MMGGSESGAGDWFKAVADNERVRKNDAVNDAIHLLFIVRGPGVNA